MKSMFTKSATGSAVGLSLWLALTVSAAMGQAPAVQQAASAPQCTPSRSTDEKRKAEEPVAVMAGRAIYESELDEAAAPQIVPLRNQEYQIKSRVLEELLRQRVVEAEAKKHGLTVDQLYIQEVDSKIPAPSEGEVAAYYQGVKSQFKNPFEQVKAQLRTNLKALETKQARQDYAESLRAKTEVTVLLRQPKVEVAADPARLRGDPKAPITIVEFADFQCPYCKQTEATLNDLLKKYPGQVNLSFRDFPLGSIHANAQKASEAARCAGKQNKYWQFHDALFASQAALDEAGLNVIAQNLALNVPAFQSCVASGEYKTQVSRDLEDGKKAGISSTPGFFVNGVFLSGAQPETAFQKVIDDQLATAKNQPVTSSR